MERQDGGLCQCALVAAGLPVLLGIVEQAKHLGRQALPHGLVGLGRLDAAGQDGATEEAGEGDSADQGRQRYAHPAGSTS